MAGQSNVADPLAGPFNALPLVSKTLPDGKTVKIRSDQDKSVPVRNSFYTLAPTKQPSSMACFDSSFDSQPFEFELSGIQLHSLESIQAQFTIQNKEANGAVTHSPGQFYWSRVELWYNDQLINQANLSPAANYYGLVAPQEEEQTRGYAITCAFDPVTYVSTNTWAVTDATRNFIVPMLIPGLDRSGFGLAFRKEKLTLKFYPAQRSRFTESGSSVNSPVISNFTLILDGLNCIEPSDVALLRSKWDAGNILIRDNKIIVEAVDYLACTAGVPRNDIQVRQTGSLSHAFVLVQPSGTVSGAPMYQSQALTSLSITDSAGTDLLSNVAPSASFIENYLLNKLFVSPFSVTSTFPVYGIIGCADPQVNMTTGISTGAIKLTGRERWYWVPSTTANLQLYLIQYFNGGLCFLPQGQGAQWYEL